MGNNVASFCPDYINTSMKISPNELQKLKEHWIAGATVMECARIFKVDRRTIHRYIHVLGLKPKSTGRPRKQ